MCTSVQEINTANAADRISECEVEQLHLLHLPVSVVFCVVVAAAVR